MNNVDSDHGDPVVTVHLHCLCDFSLLRYGEVDPSAACSFRITIRTSFGLFILGYFINMQYCHIDKGASICERSVLSFVIQVLILHTKRTFYSAV